MSVSFYIHVSFYNTNSSSKVRLLDHPDSNEEKFVDTKGVLWSHKSKEDRQYHDQNKKRTKGQIEVQHIYPFCIFIVAYILYFSIWISAQPVFTNDNILTQYGEFGKNVDINVYVYSMPKYTTKQWYRDNTSVSTKYAMSERAAIVNDTFHGKYVQLDGYSVTLTINNLKQSDFNVSYRLKLSYVSSQTVQYTVLLESASKY